MEKVLLWFADRLVEPSTWAGSGIVAVGVHALFPGELGNAVMGLIVAASGVLSIVLREKGTKK